MLGIFLKHDQLAKEQNSEQTPIVLELGQLKGPISGHSARLINCFRYTIQKSCGLVDIQAEG